MATAKTTEAEAPETPEPVIVVPDLPEGAVEGEVVRTAGPTAEATIEANVGEGPSKNSSGIPDGALGQHAEHENEVVGPHKFQPEA